MSSLRDSSSCCDYTFGFYKAVVLNLAEILKNVVVLYVRILDNSPNFEMVVAAYIHCRNFNEVQFRSTFWLDPDNHILFNDIVFTEYNVTAFCNNFCLGMNDASMSKGNFAIVAKDNISILATKKLSVHLLILLKS
jgi:hypothetical protein